MAALSSDQVSSQALVWGSKIDNLYELGEECIENKNYQKAIEIFEELALFLQSHGAEKPSPFQGLVAEKIQQLAEKLQIPSCPDCGRRHRGCLIQ